MSLKRTYKKQKIRGWKRKVKELERWKNRCIDLDIDIFTSNTRFYVKIWLHPFYSLNTYTLPNWYKRQIVKALEEIYESWKRTMDTFNEPYYLKIWIFEKDFIRSQVVVSFRETVDFYERTFDLVTTGKSLPLYLRVREVEKLAWSEGIDVAIWSEGELIENVKINLYSEKEAEEIRKAAYYVEQRGDDLIYVLKNDVVWIGGNF